MAPVPPRWPPIGRPDALRCPAGLCSGALCRGRRGSCGPRRQGPRLRSGRGGVDSGGPLRQVPPGESLSGTWVRLREPAAHCPTQPRPDPAGEVGGQNPPQELCGSPEAQPPARHEVGRPPQRTLRPPPGASTQMPPSSLRAPAGERKRPWRPWWPTSEIARRNTSAASPSSGGQRAGWRQ